MQRLQEVDLCWQGSEGRLGVVMLTRKIFVVVRSNPRRLVFLLERVGKRSLVLDTLHAFHLRGERRHRFVMPNSLGTPQNMTENQTKWLLRRLGIGEEVFEEVYGASASIAELKNQYDSLNGQPVIKSIQLRLLAYPPLHPDDERTLSFIAGTRKRHLILTSIASALSRNPFTGTRERKIMWSTERTYPILLNLRKYAKAHITSALIRDEFAAAKAAFKMLDINPDIVSTILQKEYTVQ